MLDASVQASVNEQCFNVSEHSTWLSALGLTVRYFEGEKSIIAFNIFCHNGP